jgi:hypothetical protein
MPDGIVNTIPYLGPTISSESYREKSFLFRNQLVAILDIGIADHDIRDPMPLLSLIF